MKKSYLLSTIIVCFMVVNTIQSQSNSITTAAPFLLITPDARAGGMGDIGVATSSDAFSLFHNPSKIAFNTNQISIGVNYTPWLRNLVDDIFVGGLSYVNRFSENAAWAVDFKYFSLGKIELTDSSGNSIGTENPNELAVSGSYALKLSETFSMGVGLRYIHSNYKLSVQNPNIKAINSFSVDVSGYYRSLEENYGTFNGRYRLGFNISNIGPKVSYVPGKEDFIPTNLRLGGGFDFILDDYNIIGINLETTKLLVPTPQPDNSDKDKGFISGMFSSFGDAPGGFSEEIKEFTYALGAEYLYNNAFALRAGYYHESEDKGNRQYFTMGGGFKARSFSLDLSYLMNSSNVNHPLENTLRFSLSFDLGEIYDDY
ncbi:type IX secretion system outer membrane channel protein PorV [Polaribacter gochangensis]|uniref:type IX secretion system outer membrane channel protein PorV n=1 Tax=Polaribacter gochangensis TaxID=3252903 RepID=UPI003904B4E3